MGKSVVVIGAQWGDEGKGKVVDLLTDRARQAVTAHDFPLAAELMDLLAADPARSLR